MIVITPFFWKLHIPIGFYAHAVTPLTPDHQNPRFPVDSVGLFSLVARREKLASLSYDV